MVSSFLAGGPGRTFVSWDPRRAADLDNKVVSFRRTDPGGLELLKLGDVWGNCLWGQELVVGVDCGFTSL